MNFISFSRLTEDNADEAIKEQIAYFRPHKQPFEWKVYDHDSPADLKERLVAHGFQAGETDAIMVLDLKNIPESLLEPVQADIRPIKTREQLADVIQIEKEVWGGKFDWLENRLGDHLEIPYYLSVYVAYINDEPASAGWIYFHNPSQFTDLWGGSTLARFRNRGLYTALLATRAQEALIRGYHYLTIDAGPMSRPIVARHGFRLLTYAHDYEWNAEHA